MTRIVTRLLLAAASLLSLASLGLWAQTGLTASPQNVSIAAALNSTVVHSQPITVVSTGGPASFTTSVRYVSGAPGWLVVTPVAGVTPTTLTVSVNPANLTVGGYLGQVLLRSGVLETYVSVALTIGNSGSGRVLFSNPSAITFVAQGNTDQPAPKILNVAKTFNAPSGPLSFRVSAAATSNWLTAIPGDMQAPATVPVMVNPAGLANGRYDGTVTIIPATGDPTVVPVTLLVGTGPEPNQLNLSQSGMVFFEQSPAVLTPPQTVRVTTVPVGTIFTASTTSDRIRLTSPSNPTQTDTLTETAPADVQVTVFPSGLIDGVYTGEILFTAQGLPTQELTVQLQLSPGAGLNVNPSSLVIRTDQSTTRTLAVTSYGSQSLTFSATTLAGAPWLAVSPTSTTTTSGTANLTVSVNTQQLDPGTYDGTIQLVVQGNNKTLTVPVRLVLRPPTGEGILVLPTDSVTLEGVIGGPPVTVTGKLNTAAAGSTLEFMAADESTQGWLAVGPFRGVAPTDFQLTANPAAVPGPGSYPGTITFTSLVSGTPYPLPVTFNVSAKSIATNPQTLTFVQNQFGVAPPAQTVAVTTNLPGTFQVSGLPPWAKADPLLGTSPGVIRVTVDPTGRPPGTVEGSFVIDGNTSRATVSLSMTVAEAPGPTVSANALSFSHQMGSPPPATQRVQVASNTPMTEVAFAASPTTESGVDWLVVGPGGGTTPSALNIGINPGRLTPGVHKGSVSVASTNGAVRRTIDVSLSVMASGTSVMGVLHGATFAATPIAPGLLISLTGAGLGPDVGVVAKPTAAGAIETQLGGTQVLFDGVPAPLLFARTDQVNAVVPYSVYGRANVRMVVVRGRDYSVPLDLRVVDSAPGLFTLGFAGTGQIAAVNADGTTNSANNPAPRGSIVSIYATGEGQTSPAGQDGRIVLTDLRRPLLPVTATVGGQPATVIYAGSAPTLVSGVLQVNLQIPEDVPAGPLPLVVSVGGVASQTGATIAVK